MRAWGGRAENELVGEGKRHANRLIGLAVAAFLWALLVLFNLVLLQVVSHRTYLKLAADQQQYTGPVEAPRGAIFDRGGRVLAMSVVDYNISVDPRKVPDRVTDSKVLANVLGLDRQELRERMDAAVEEHREAIEQKRKAKGTGYLLVKREISPAEYEALRGMNIDWVQFEPAPHRYYPDGPLASHVVGTVDFQGHGNLGLERKLEGELAGRPGRETDVRDVMNRTIESTVLAAAEPGKNLTLTIDESIQFVAERELKAACELYHAASGSAVVMDPHTGEVLAMASYPTFDANQPPQPGEPPTARFNYPVSVAFEPGSVFKIVTLSAALETTNLRPETPINCGNGTINLFGRIIHESHHGYGTIPMADVLAKSSNIGAIQIGLKVGEKNLLDYVHKFGFGKITGIPLPAESSGMVRDLKHWGKTSIGSVAMGHEVSTTALQLAQACSVIANGGVLVRPRLILKRQRPGGPVENEPAPPPQRVLKPETAITMRQMMEGVVLRGTGKAARLAGYTSGGKTGSAQIFDTETKHYTHLYNGSFVGFAPVTNPAVVIAVTLNNVKMFGGVVAAPVFKNVATETLRLLGVPKDIPDVEPEPLADPQEANDVAIADMSNPPDDLAPPQQPPAPAAQPAAPAAPAPPVLMGSQGPVVLALGPAAPSFAGKTVRAVLEQSLAMGVQVEVIGSGIARQQLPAAGSPLAPGEKVRVVFQ